MKTLIKLATIASIAVVLLSSCNDNHQLKDDRVRARMHSNTIITIHAEDQILKVGDSVMIYSAALDDNWRVDKACPFTHDTTIVHEYKDEDNKPAMSSISYKRVVIVK
jgi:hypothetical protein